MTLPSSGSISIAQIRDEYGMGNPISMSQLYGKPGIQGSGAISFSNFHGKSNASWSKGEGYYEQTGSPGSIWTITCSIPCVWTYTKSGSGSVTPASGSTSSSLTFTVSAPNNNSSAFGSISLTGTAGGLTKSWSVGLTGVGRNIA